MRTDYTIPIRAVLRILEACRVSATTTRTSLAVEGFPTFETPPIAL